ncbi:putative calcium-transporting ATPase 13, plasma membrane-type [Camellia lanceoleosa]|uniref:Calcium-transporting ATPase 13, plasma membrane-type n=1 Tax=Camellia lanceoleosa TaxID=1840588 RepID=A0ACC0IDE8_9ERIC|nr:putative calcium-transporting ATPase 13, plasma membrane-type [Camellia lanceoleosa]
MIKEKNSNQLHQFRGAKGMAGILETNEKDGIKGNDAHLIHRKAVFDSNRIKQHGLKDWWYDGGSIVFVVFLGIAISAVSNFIQSRQFAKLSNESSDINVEVVRDARRQQISIFDVVVGDIVCLKIGDQIPADRLFMNGHSLKVDESSMTGERDHVEINGTNNPFFLSGTKVTDGYGFMIVTSVGMNTAWGEMMSSISRDLNEQTPLQAQLNKPTSHIDKVGLAFPLLVHVIMMIRYFTGNTLDELGTKIDDVMNEVVQIIAAAVTIVVVAILRDAFGHYAYSGILDEVNDGRPCHGSETICV